YVEYAVIELRRGGPVEGGASIEHPAAPQIKYPGGASYRAVGRQRHVDRHQRRGATLEQRAKVVHARGATRGGNGGIGRCLYVNQRANLVLERPGSVDEQPPCFGPDDVA